MGAFKATTNLWSHCYYIKGWHEALCDHPQANKKSCWMMIHCLDADGYN